MDLDDLLDGALDEMGDSLAAAAKQRQEEEAKRKKEVERQHVLLQQHKQREEAAKTKVKGKGKAKASSEYGPSKNRARTEDKLDAFVALPADRRAAWAQAVADDARRQARLPKQKPFSRAHRAFATKRESVAVHAGSELMRSGGEDAAVAAAAAVGTGGAGSGSAAAVPRKVTMRYFEEILHKSFNSTGISPPEHDASEGATFERLKALYLQQIVLDARKGLVGDLDVDPHRFPHLAAQMESSAGAVGKQG